MPGYGNIGGSWRGLTGGGYANIGGSWRQITAGYQNRGGTWEKVFPNYADYGDTVKLYSSKYITIGYARDTSSTIYSGADGTTQGSTNIQVAEITQASLAPYFWFPTQQKMDLRAYNYAAILVYCYTSRTNTTGTPYTYIRPFFALSDNINGSPTSDTIIYGADDTTGQQMSINNEHPLCTLIDLSNCTAESKYLKFGYQIGSRAVLSNPYVWGRLNIGEDIILYKNKSDCNINTSDYDRSWTLTY